VLKIINKWVKYLTLGGLGILFSFPVQADKFWTKIFMKEVPQKSKVSGNAISLYCGKNCNNCGLSQNQCLKEAKAQLKELCSNTDSSKVNCYELWLTITETCKELCLFE
jgi:hypothetical protein